MTAVVLDDFTVLDVPGVGTRLVPPAMARHVERLFPGAVQKYSPDQPRDERGRWAVVRDSEHPDGPYRWTAGVYNSERAALGALRGAAQEGAANFVEHSAGLPVNIAPAGPRSFVVVQHRADGTVERQHVFSVVRLSADKYSESEPRDERGRWTADGGGAAITTSAYDAKWPGTPPTRSVIPASIAIDGQEHVIEIPGVNASGNLATDADPALARMALDRLDALQTQFPGVTATVQVQDLSHGWQYTPDEASRIGAVTTQDHITLNSRFFGQQPQMWTMGGAGWGVDDTPEGIITHEFGHVLDSKMLSADPPGGRDAQRAYLDWRGQVLNWPQHEGALGSDSWRQYRMNWPVVSGYAKTDAKERIAETFTAAYTPGNPQYDNPGAAALRAVLDPVFGRATKAGNPLAFADAAKRVLRRGYAAAYRTGQAAAQRAVAAALGAPATPEAADDPAEEADSLDADLTDYDEEAGYGPVTGDLPADAPEEEPDDEAPDLDDTEDPADMSSDMLDAAMNDMGVVGAADLPPDGQDAVDSGVDWSWGGLLGIGSLLGAGLASMAAVQNWLDSYSSGLYGLFQQGFGDAVAEMVPDPSEVECEWQSLDDAGTCEDCAALDGQTWALDEDHPWPGNSRFGGEVRCGPRCRCALLYRFVTPDGAAVDLGSSSADDSPDAIAAAATADMLKAFNPDEPRDWHGRWSTEDGYVGHEGVDPGGSQPVMAVVHEQEFWKGLDRTNGIFARRFTSAERMAMLSYRGDGFRSLNRALNTGGKLSADDRRTMRGLDSALAKAAPLKEPMIVWRGGGMPDGGYVSTAGSREGMRNLGYGRGDIAEVRVPAGTKVLFLGGPPDEILLPRGWRPPAAKYSPDQPRDEAGRWTAGGGAVAADRVHDLEAASAGPALGEPQTVAVPWKTPDEALRYFTQRWPGVVDASMFGDRADWSRTGPALAALDRCMTEFPGVVKAQGLTVALAPIGGSDPDGITLAQTEAHFPGSTVTFNEAVYGKGGVDVWKIASGSGWWVPGTTNPAGSAWHEFGHVYFNYMVDGHSDPGQSADVHPSAAMLSFNRLAGAMQRLPPLSGYARSSPGEWFAEAFNATYNPDSQAGGRPEPKAVRDLVAAEGGTAAAKYREDEPRDWHGRWTLEGASTAPIADPAVHWAADRWAHGYSEQIRGQIRNPIVRFDMFPNAEDYDRMARSLLQAVQDAPPLPHALYRGISFAKDEAQKYAAFRETFKPGATVDMNLSSWSRSQSVALQFASNSFGTGLGFTEGGVPDFSAHQVVFALEPGAKALDISQDTPQGPRYSEHLTDGRFDVSAVRHEDFKWGTRDTVFVRQTDTLGIDQLRFTKAVADARFIDWLEERSGQRMVAPHHALVPAALSLAKAGVAGLSADDLRRLRAAVQKYSPDQPRDERGRWSAGGGGGAPDWWGQPSTNAFARGMTEGEVTLDWLARHGVARDGDRYVLYRGEPRVHRDLRTPREAPTTLAPGTLLATDPEEARGFAGRYERDVPASKVDVFAVRVLPWQIYTGHWPSLREAVPVGETVPRKSTKYSEDEPRDERGRWTNSGEPAAYTPLGNGGGRFNAPGALQGQHGSGLDPSMDGQLQADLGRALAAQPQSGPGTTFTAASTYEEPYARLVVERGEQFPVKGAKATPESRGGQWGECHSGTARMVQANPDRYDHVYGYAYSKSGPADHWVTHSWAVDRQTGRVVDATPEVRDGYFGARLTPDEARRFAIGEGVTKLSTDDLLALRAEVAKGFNPDEPRDERGRWTADGGGLPAEGRAAQWPTDQGPDGRGSRPLPESVMPHIAEDANSTMDELHAQQEVWKERVAAQLADRLGTPEAIAALAGSPITQDLYAAGMDYAQQKANADNLPDARYPLFGAVEHDWATASDAQRQQWLQDPYIRNAVAAGFVHNWANTSSDSDPTALAIQMAAAREFGLPDTVVNRSGAFAPGAAPASGLGPGGTYAEQRASFADLSTAGQATAILDQSEPALRALVRASYDNTQAAFAAAGITEVTVTRGITQAPPEVPTRDNPILHMPTADFGESGMWSGTVTSNPLSSWTTDRSVARGFGDYHLTTTVPVSRVFSTAATGPGCALESEVVLIGGPTKVTADRLWS